jgi:hypothetical protein
MIVYRVELWCDGCKRKSHVRRRRRPSTSLWLWYYEHAGLPDAVFQMIERAEQDDHWITDGLEHFCPHCQVQRKAG